MDLEWRGRKLIGALVGIICKLTTVIEEGDDKRDNRIIYNEKKNTNDSGPPKIGDMGETGQPI